MKKNLLAKAGLIAAFLIISGLNRSFGQGSQTPAWTTNPFNSEEFIENKGQFTSRQNELNEPILFAVHREGLSIYFTAKGVSWCHVDIKEKEESLLEKLMKKGAAESEEFEATTRLVHMQWENANPGVKVIGEAPLSYYRCYGDEKNTSNTLVANVYSKIVYRNIYPNIDIEYYFPKGENGIKYNVTLHPGADVSLLKMKYSKVKRVAKDVNGNIVVSSSLGPIIDHAPTSYDRDGKIVPSAFELIGNSVSFKVQTPQNSDIVIDPWVTNPLFSTINKAYDVDYDKYGNVFAYGAVNAWSPATSFELVKIDNTGAIKWKYSTNLFSDQAPSPGDFFVDYNSGRAYIFEGENLGPPFNAGNNNSAEAIKLDAAGILLKFYIPANPTQSMTEFTRATYNCATKTMVVAGGGVAGCWQAATFDTSLNLMSYQNVLASQGVTNPWNNSYHDIALLASDNAGNCYMLANRSYAIDPAHADNYLFKAPMIAPQNNTWGVSSYHHFIEEGTGIPKKYGMDYTNIYLQNGYNGMAVNCNFLCTSDGHVMKKWNKNNGALIKQVVISPDSLDFGGLDISHCDHIYAGYYNTIKIFDANLNAISSLTAHDTVYDLKLDEFRSVVYAVGRGFVSAITINENCNDNIFITTLGAACSNASATVQDTGITACATESYYSYLWSTGDTTQTIANLSAGTYSVIVTHDYMMSCHPYKWVDTAFVVITGGATPPSVTTTHVNIFCSNNGGIATAQVTAGIPPYAYSWMPSGGTTASVSGLSPGTYTVVVADGGGCTKIDTVSIASIGSITATATNATICAGQHVTISATGGANYVWSTGATTSAITPLATAAATYSVIVSVGGCADTAFASLAVNPSPIVALGNDPTICAGQNYTLDAGNPGASYIWSTGDNSQVIMVTDPGNYWVIAALNNCISTDTLKISIPPAVNLFDTSLCSTSPIVLDAGSGASSYYWSTGNTTHSIEVDSAGTYWVTVMFGSCATTAVSTIDGMPGGGNLYVPNAFTPNDDHLNETFLAVGTGINTFEMEVFDRWGNLIFASDDINKGWNGKIEGGHYILKEDGEEAAQEDVYVWKINYTMQCAPKNTRNKMGHVSIVK